jgi:putative ABC transport system ATP-binding protein
VLELQNVVKLFPIGDGEPVHAVDSVSLTVASGELVALYGPSGSGKTTLLMMAAALLAPDSGAVLVGGREVSSLSTREATDFRLRELGFVRQSLELIPGASALDNAALKLLATGATPREAKRGVQPLIERLGLAERSAHRAEQLSMGERQRVMIARALSTDPKLVLADEPTGSLDSERGREVLDLLTSICCERQVAVLLVTHDPRAAGYAHRVHALRDGKLESYEPDLGSIAASGSVAVAR